MSKEKETKRSIGPAGASIVSEGGKKIKNTSQQRDAVETIIEKALSRLGGGRQAVKKLIKQFEISKEDKTGQALGPAGKRVKEMAKGGEVKKYKKGGAVKKKNKILTTKGFGASRKT